MATLTPSPLTYTQVFAPVVVVNNGQGTRYTLDLTTKRGAWVYGRIGRRVATALTRSGYIAIRPTQNSTLQLPNTRFDLVSSIAAAISTTLNGAASSGSSSATLTSGTSFAIGDTICIHSDDSSANRVEFLRIALISTNTINGEFNLSVSHNNADRVTTQADVFVSWLPGGDVYEIRAENFSGQDLVFALDVAVDNGDTY